MYQSEWTDKQVLHLFPHWNWLDGQDIDLWCYYNNADEVELFVNGISQGVKSKADSHQYHLMWRVKFEPGEVKAVARKDGKEMKQAMRVVMVSTASGGTGSGKTTTLNVLSSFIPNDERIVTIEDAAELRLQQQHVVTLEGRPANIEGKGQITIRDLVRNALRMRPDRIIVGEVRSGEALDMLQAMNTGHDGSLTNAHANSPRDALSRLETMVLMSGLELPVRAIREQVASAVDIIIQQSRMKDGSRKITHITEVQHMEGDTITTQDIFRFEQTGLDSDGKIQGFFSPTGLLPGFLDKFRLSGVTLPEGFFAQTGTEMDY